jgi:hypothetical protein
LTSGRVVALTARNSHFASMAREEGACPAVCNGRLRMKRAHTVKNEDLNTASRGKFIPLSMAGSRKQNIVMLQENR